MSCTRQVAPSLFLPLRLGNGKVQGPRAAVIYCTAQALRPDEIYTPPRTLHSLVCSSTRLDYTCCTHVMYIYIYMHVRCTMYLVHSTSTSYRYIVQGTMYLYTCDEHLTITNSCAHRATERTGTLHRTESLYTLNTLVESVQVCCVS